MHDAKRLTGQVLGGRYRVGPKLAEGGAGAVYRAEHLVLREAVAVKVLHADVAANLEMSKRFMREVTVASRLDHPNVVAMYDSGTLDDGSLYYVMELLEGASLAEAMTVGRLAPARALGLVRQLLDALGHAHARGVAHRDVKPENVMLVRRAGVETVKLVDFGIAGDEEATEKLTATGVAFGTPEYLSPEMAMGQKTDGRADVYAVGVMLFEMLAGRHPFAGLTGSALVRAHALTRPPSPREVAPEAAISPALEAVILRAMVKVPEDRFASAAEMKEALIQAAAAPAIPAPETEARQDAGAAAPSTEPATAQEGGWLKRLRWPWGSRS
ncbi:MAG TPA: serine/threonine-protein kinase [Polyangia bacterium]|jgi:serine/threonine-protein kinase|nr:serine/threonine-protein kinase [Polyangia bacterium]